MTEQTLQAANFAIQALVQQRETLAAKLADLEKQEPIGAIYTINGVQHCTITKSVEDTDLFTSHGAQSQDARDAARYRWLAAYLVSDDTQHDDPLVDCSSVEAMTAFIDAAMTQEAK